MRFRRHMWLASIFLLIPVVALVVVGILVLVFQRATVDITFGVLILTFCVTLLVGAIVLVVSLKRADRSLAAAARFPLQGVARVPHAADQHPAVHPDADGAAPAHRRSAPAVSVACSTTRPSDSSTMIGRLLDFGRMEAGKMVYHRQPESVDAVVDAAAARLRADPAARARRARHVGGARICRRSSPTARCSARRCSTCCRTPPSTAATDGEIDLVCRAENGHVALSRRRQGARASRAASGGASSSASTASTTGSTASRKAAASASPSSATSCRRTAARWWCAIGPHGGAEFSILLPTAS